MYFYKAKKWTFSFKAKLFKPIVWKKHSDIATENLVISEKFMTEIKSQQSM